VTLFAVVAVILIGISEAQDRREAGIPEPSTDGRARGAYGAERLKSLQSENK
jgi:hypothetical protein